MNSFLKYLGIIVVVLGALLLIIPAFLHATSNTTLATAGILMVLGLIGHILLNKYLAE